MTVAEYSLKQQLIREVENLRPEKWRQVLNFVLFLKSHFAQEGTRIRTPSLAASHLDHVTGLVAWGGNALNDAECLYDESL